MIITTEPVCCAPTGDRCGEGVLWHPEENAVYWTDINRFLIHRFNPASGTVKSWLFDEPVTAVLLTDRDGVLAICLGSRLILWDPSSDSRKDHSFHLPGWPAVRLNDAGVDPRGSLWAGSMRNNVNADGSEGEAGGTDGVLFRVDPDGSFNRCQEEIGISNTLVWSADNKKFYFGDTLENAIWAYDYDEHTGGIGKPNPFFSGFSRGLPDGSTIDADGYVWNCRWGGSYRASCTRRAGRPHYRDADTEHHQLHLWRGFFKHALCHDRGIAGECRGRLGRQPLCFGNEYPGSAGEPFPNPRIDQPPPLS